MGWTCPIMEDLKQGHFRGISVNSDEMGWIGSFATLGALTMCIPTGFICDLIGRKRTLLLLVAPFVGGWLLIVFAKNILMIYFGRLFTGMAVGATCVAAPLYTGEIAHKKLRGTLGSYFQLMVTLGILYAYVLGKYLSVYRFTIVCSALPVFFLISFAFQPESPAFLLKRGCFEDAKVSLTKLRGASYNVDEELLEIEECLKEVTHTTVSIRQILRKRSTIKAMIILFSLMLFQQFSGINTIVLYTSNIFQKSGVQLDANVAAIIVGAFQAFATFVASLTIEKLGRRFLLILSASILALSTCTLALFFTLRDRSHIDLVTLLHYIGFLPVASVCMFVTVFSLGLGPIPWMISSEILAPEIKSVISSVAATFNWFLAFIVTKFFLQVNEAVGEDVTFYFFAFMSLVGTVFIYLVVPETKGKSLRDIQFMLEN